MKLFLLSLSIVLASCATRYKKEDIQYSVNNKDFKAFVAAPDSAEKKPGIIIVHEWWGLNEYVKDRAEMLAKEGYVAMSIDMYGNGKNTEHPKEAGEFAKMAMQNPKAAKERFTKALSVLKNRPDVDPNKIAAIGYCFGGGVVLNMVRMGVDLDIAASFHGSLSSKMKAKKNSFDGKVLVFNGKADPMTTKDDIVQFKQEMTKASIDYEFYNYENAKHAFTNSRADFFAKKYDLPLGYNAKADKDSWKILLSELKQL